MDGETGFRKDNKNIKFIKTYKRPDKVESHNRQGTRHIEKVDKINRLRAIKTAYTENTLSAAVRQKKTFSS